MGRRGSLSKKTYFPNPGDMLEDRSEGICWEVRKVHNHKHEETETSYRYCVFLADIEDYDEPILRMANDREGVWFLDEIDVIKRKKAGGYVDYEWNEMTETWQS